MTRLPYLKEVMDELINYDTERIIFVKPTQVGGTEALQNMLGYVIQQDPSPTMIVYPTDILAKSISENRLEPMIMATRTLKSLYNKNESSQLELQFDGMYLSLAGSNSPSSLASKAIKYLFLDEVDKYPGSSKKESDPNLTGDGENQDLPKQEDLHDVNTNSGHRPYLESTHGCGH